MFPKKKVKGYGVGCDRVCFLRKPGDPAAARQGRLRIDVDLREHGLWILVRHLFINRRECPARSAPRCPEVNKYDRIIGNYLGEILFRQS